jgi:hypothetical protein
MIGITRSTVQLRESSFQEHKEKSNQGIIGGVIFRRALHGRSSQEVERD